MCRISGLIVSKTKFSLVIGSPNTYLLRIDSLSRACPNKGVRFELYVIEYPRDSHVNYKHFNGFLCNVSFSFQNLGKALQTFSLRKSCLKTFLSPKFVMDTIN